MTDPTPRMSEFEDAMALVEQTWGDPAKFDARAIIRAHVATLEATIAALGAVAEAGKKVASPCDQQPDLNLCDDPCEDCTIGHLAAALAHPAVQAYLEREKQ